MTLSDILKNFKSKDFDVIEYRSKIKEGDILVGMASYKNKMLISLDGDTYCLRDEIEKYELYKDNWLVVWV